MVTVTKFAKRVSKDGTSFIALELTGKLELIKSQTTGRFYATVRRCSLPSTFDEEVAALMVGTKVEGDIVRVEVEPYELISKRTGEVLLLTHSWAYQPPNSSELVAETPVMELENA